MKKGKMHRLTTIILVLIFAIGVILLLYPIVSNYWNSLHQTRAITSYLDDVSNIQDADYEKVWEDAIAYNEELAEKGNSWVLSEEEYERYEKQLDVSNSGVLGCIEIASLDIFLPIYHGISDSVLQSGVGHIEGSSLPTGGANTHCVLSGHRGLPSAKLFTNLDELKEGDTFVLRILDEVLTYQVDQIHIVEPEDVETLFIEENKDLCTLVTCTPYGINTHRLLVRGTRVESEAEAQDIRIVADAMPVDELIVSTVVAIIMLTVLVVGISLISKKEKVRKEADK